MSSHIVEDETLNNILSWVHYSKNDVWLKDKLESLFEKHDIDLDNHEHLQKLFNTMKKLNCDATGERYNDENPVLLTSLKLQMVCPYQAIKSLRCWIYQCSEGEFHKTIIYKLFEELKNIIALKIVEDNPTYENAKWG